MRDTFLKEIRSGIGSSDAPKILGYSPFAGAMQVYLSKIEPTNGNRLNLEMAKRRESSMAWIFTELTDSRLNEEETFFRHPDQSCLITHPDRLILNGDNEIIGLAEFKVVGPTQEHRWGEPETDQVPEYVIIELQHRMGILNEQPDIKRIIKQATVLRWLRAWDKYDFYYVPYDADFARSILSKCAAFWIEYIVPQRPPHMDGTPAGDEFLKRKFPQVDEITIKATPPIEVMVETYKGFLQTKAAVDKEVATYLQRLKFAMGTAAVMELANGDYITYRNVKGSVSWKNVAAELSKHVSADEYAVLQANNRAENYRRFNVPRSWQTKEE
jgi:predicted phage-related endonuclease